VKKVKKDVVEVTPTQEVEASMMQTHELLRMACARLSFPELEILINLARMMEWARIGQKSRGILFATSAAAKPARRRKS